MVKRAIEDRRYRDAINALRAARTRSHLTQAQLAAKLGKRQQFVSKYESGERRLDVIEFMDVANALGLAPQTLVEGMTAPEPDS